MDRHLLNDCVNWPSTNGQSWYLQKYNVIIGPRVDDVMIPTLLTQNNITIPDIITECSRFEEELKYLLSFTFGKPPVDDEEADVDVEGNSSNDGSVATDGFYQHGDIANMAREIRMDSYDDEEARTRNYNAADSQCGHGTFDYLKSKLYYCQQKQCTSSYPKPVVGNESGECKSFPQGLPQHPMDHVFDLDDPNEQKIYRSNYYNGGRLQSGVPLKLDAKPVDGTSKTGKMTQ